MVVIGVAAEATEAKTAVAGVMTHGWAGAVTAVADMNDAVAGSTASGDTTCEP
jgi:hypothetical protein